MDSVGNSANSESFIEDFEAFASKYIMEMIGTMFVIWLNYHYLCRNWHLNFHICRINRDLFNEDMENDLNPDFRKEMRRVCIIYCIQFYGLGNLITAIVLQFDPSSRALNLELLAFDILVGKNFWSYNVKSKTFFSFQMFAVLLELFLDIMGVTWTTFGMLLIALWLRYETLKLMCHWIGGIADIHKVIQHNFYEHILEEKGNKIRLHL